MGGWAAAGWTSGKAGGGDSIWWLILKEDVYSTRNLKVERPSQNVCPFILFSPNTIMHRFKSQGMSTRLFKRGPWVAPKDRVQTWNIVTGDKVTIFFPAIIKLPAHSEWPTSISNHFFFSTNVGRHHCRKGQRYHWRD
jgi:hypothetical protein